MSKKRQNKIDLQVNVHQVYSPPPPSYIRANGQVLAAKKGKWSVNIVLYLVSTSKMENGQGAKFGLNKMSNCLKLYYSLVKSKVG